MAITFMYNGIDFSDVLTLNNVTGRGITPSELSTTSVSGMVGSHFLRKNRGPREIEADYTFVGEDLTDLRNRIDNASASLDLDGTAPLVFSDEPDKTYYAVMSSDGDMDEETSIGQGTVTFFCPDPRKYGAEQTLSLTGQGTNITVPGTTETTPVFELNVLAPITFAMVANGRDEYMVLGKPEEDSQSVIDAQVPVLQEDGSTLSNWTTTPVTIDSWIGQVTGTMTYDGTGIYVEHYGDTSVTYDKIHGPARTYEFTNPVQDFQIESIFDVITDDNFENFRMEVYMFDENYNMLGKFGINDNTRHMKRIRGLGRVGPYVDNTTGYAIGAGNFQKELGDASLMFFRVKREGDLYTFYISEIRNGDHFERLTNTWPAGNHSGRLRYVQIYIGKWQDRQRPFRARVNRLDVYELKQVTEDETPYRAKAGDKITFDHENRKIRLNGEEVAKGELGATPFKLQPGENVITTLPTNDVEGTVRFRPAYK